MAAEEALVSGLEAIGAGDVSLADALGMKRQVLDVLLEKALGLVTFGKHEQAESELSRLTLVDGRSPLPPFALGALLAEKKQFHAAIEAYEQAEARAEKLGSRAMVARVALCKGHAFMALGEADSARIAFTTAKTQGEPAIAKDAIKLLEVLGS